MQPQPSAIAVATFPNEPESSWIARGWARRVLLPLFATELTERLEVVVAGLVADAVRPGGNDIDVELNDLDGQIEVAVIDRQPSASPAVEVPLPGVPDEGLAAVEATAAAWGVERLRKPPRIRRWARVGGETGEIRQSI